MSDCRDQCRTETGRDLYTVEPAWPETCSIEGCDGRAAHHFPAPEGQANELPDFDDPDGHWVDVEPAVIEYEEPREHFHSFTTYVTVKHTFDQMHWTGRNKPFHYFECEAHYQGEK